MSDAGPAGQWGVHNLGWPRRRVMRGGRRNDSADQGCAAPRDLWRQREN
jgi:hypothetical protein